MSDPRVTSFSLSPIAPFKVIIYTNELRGEPAKVSLFSLTENSFQRIS